MDDLHIRSLIEHFCTCWAKRWKETRRNWAGNDFSLELAYFEFELCAAAAANGEPTESCVHRNDGVHSSVIWRIRKHHVTPVAVHAMNFFCFNHHPHHRHFAWAQRTPSTFWQPHHNFLALQSSENLSCRFREECINLFQLAGKCLQNEIGHRRICIRAQKIEICSLYCERVSARSFNRH